MYMSVFSEDKILVDMTEKRLNHPEKTFNLHKQRFVPFVLVCKFVAKVAILRK